MPNEFDLIHHYFKRATPSAILGPGDDCALVSASVGCELAITTDMLVAGTHFLADTDPLDLGWKTLAVNISDLAAMGAHPRWALLAGSLPEADENWLAAFSDGFFSAAKAFAVDLIGGDLTRGPLNLCVTAIGEVKAGQALRRDRAQKGDDLWVSGTPGMAALALAEQRGKFELPAALRATCIEALQRPQPRVTLGLGLVHLAHAAIDVSDGLLADTSHLLERSKLRGEVFIEQLPPLPEELGSIKPTFFRSCQLAGGDDYELVFTAPPAARNAIDALASALMLPLYRFGCASATNRENAGKITIFDAHGAPLDIERKGYDHFD